MRYVSSFSQQLHTTNRIQLVQTAKALRASRRDDQGNLVQAQGVLQSKLPDTVNAFHSALDDLDHNIVSATSRSVMSSLSS